MKLLECFAVGLAIKQTAAIGFSTYAQLVEGADNSGQIAYSKPDRSTTLFLYIQITPDGADHSNIISQFNTLAENYGSQGISVIPRVRYGYSDGSIATEPDESILMNDVSTWAGVFSNITGTIDIPVIQAGFLGQWGEWHDGQYCQAHGTADTAADLKIKKSIVDTLLGSGHKVALRYPQDHQAMYNGSRTVTLHDDCIFDGGPNGTDGGTWPSDDRQTWIDYTKKVSSNNTFGGEGCDDAGDATFDWSDYGAVCGSDGIAAYINAFQIAYLNAYNPKKFQALFEDSSETDCVNAIQAALEQWS
ncbi:hypothetical protein BGW36DRAFT_333852 [Talaromyces proteolyticus]|uniref:DUF4874 domain-containing protein n=1 Tax=Talaromyces proteolyticus TaxID=1131652 RepID=A0AAD4L2V1_9EURO|nr:uncharacterized protein BGW36DRAFT_333852 [Talaromyces proteolyticus]KAH8703198.1 hypothetical protein BGW36DRAFT_333852 [Talaromyces proteolyticus]